ncbi:MAG: zinc-binding dehydrogenase [Deltaproteobacteria bacterium]|nr:zinc-binding dehydrogenase [Deltaproteobacteria bacterium]
MKAIRFHEIGEPEVLRLEDVPDPTPPPGAVLIRVRAIGINYADTRFRRGAYFVTPKFPQIPGMEVAGEIAALGDGSAGVAVGDRVMALCADAYAEYVVARPHDLYPIPDGMDFATAAALPAQGLTAHHLLGLAGRLQRGERVLVHAAAGGVGTLLVQLARLAGASQIFGTAGGPDKCALVRELGADVAIDYKSENFAERVNQASAGAGADVILEMLGGAEVMKKNLACLAAFGRLVVYGAASGDLRATLLPVSLMPKNQSVIGYYLTPLTRRRELCAPALAEVAAHVVAGRVRVVIGARLPLRDAAEAHRRMESRGSTGKLVLEP